MRRPVNAGFIEAFQMSSKIFYQRETFRFDASSNEKVRTRLFPVDSRKGRL